MAAKTANPPVKQPKTKVFVVDDHPVFRDGLVRIVGQMPGLIVCGEAANAQDAFDGISKLNPGLVLMDIGLPGKSGLELLQDILAIKPELPVLVISMYDEALYAGRVLQAGGRGYIMKQEDPGEIAKAIHKVLSGKVYAAPAPLPLSSTPTPSPRPPLALRESAS